MKAYIVEYNVERYIPEYKAYLASKTFSETEVRKIAKLRESFERKICESFAPQLKDYIGYLEHLQATARMAKERYMVINEAAEQVPDEF